ncbi:MAG: class II aldolase/adducin family protein [Bacteroidales bacterium]|nr:class II aldolase/adducin family protein [Bacteroidales bacterium]
MKVIDDGVIKYDRSNFTHSGPIDLVEYSGIEYWRKILFKLNLIGEYKDARIGFGNLSESRDYSQIFKNTLPQFLITGTQTGKYSELDGNFYTRILDYDISAQKIKTMGPVEASSEALTHAAIYSANNKIKSVFHIHSPKIWEAMLDDNSDFTAENIAYGTAEMAVATQKCIAHKNFGFFCMRGHTDGVVAYGQNLIETGEIILDACHKYNLT